MRGRPSCFGWGGKVSYQEHSQQYARKFPYAVGCSSTLSEKVGGWVDCGKMQVLLGQNLQFVFYHARIIKSTWSFCKCKRQRT